MSALMSMSYGVEVWPHLRIINTPATSAPPGQTLQRLLITGMSHDKKHGYK
mgnify:CR=1 FL=1